jgi:metal-sulfur cluster biosynthetic enzyme
MPVPVPTREQLIAALRPIADPERRRSIVELGIQLPMAHGRPNRA